MSQEIQKETAKKEIFSDELQSLLDQLGTDDDDINTVNDALELIWVNRKLFEQNLVEWELVFRQELRKELMSDALLEDSPELTIEGYFDGYGDSGNTSIEHENPLVMNFLNHIINTKITFDWYNNEGGGGDITWKVVEDKIIINGYYNETQQVSVMEEEEV